MATELSLSDGEPHDPAAPGPLTLADHGGPPIRCLPLAHPDGSWLALIV